MFTYKEAQNASEAMNDQSCPEMMEPADNAPDAQLPSPTGSWEPLMEFPGEGMASFEDSNSEPSFDEATMASLRQFRLANGNENRVRESTGSLCSMGSWYELVERRDEFSIKDEESEEGACIKEPVEIDMIEDARMKSSFKPNPLDELLGMLG
jgi:hypothetical protein